MALRAGVDDLVHHTLRSDDVPAPGTPSAWVAAHRSPVMAGIAAVAALIFWVTDLSAAWWLLVAAIVILLELVAWRVARGPEVEPAAV